MLFDHVPKADTGHTHAISIGEQARIIFIQQSWQTRRSQIHMQHFHGFGGDGPPSALVLPTDFEKTQIRKKIIDVQIQ